MEDVDAVTKIDAENEQLASPTRIDAADNVGGRPTMGERAIERSLERAAVREADARMRDQIAVSTADIQQLQKHLREQRNESIESWRTASRELDTSRELKLAEFREDWLKSHDEAVKTRRAARQAQIAARNEMNQAHKQRVAELRALRNQIDDEYAAAVREARTQYELTRAERANGLSDARGEVIDARRRVQESLDALKKRDAEQRPQLKHEAAQARAEHNERADERAANVRALAQESAVAAALARDAARDGDEALSARLTEVSKKAKAEAASLRKHILAEQEADDEAFFRQQWDRDCERAIEQAFLNDPVLEARENVRVERRAVRAANKAVKAQERAALESKLAELRHEHAQRIAAIDEELRSMEVERELRLAELNESYIDAHEVDVQERRLARKAVRTARNEQREAESKIRHEMRAQKNEQADRHAEAIREARSELEYVRAMRREAARDIARGAYKKMWDERHSM